MRDVPGVRRMALGSADNRRIAIRGSGSKLGKNGFGKGKNGQIPQPTVKPGARTISQKGNGAGHNAGAVDRIISLKESDSSKSEEKVQASNIDESGAEKNRDVFCRANPSGSIEGRVVAGQKAVRSKRKDRKAAKNKRADKI